jgi:5-methylcytosine-specific restriction endonuclease McrA
MTCTQCGETKDRDLFKKQGDKRVNPCKACMVKYAVTWQQKNRKRAAKNRAKWVTENPDKMKAARQAWDDAHPENRRERRRKAKKKNPMANRASVSARRARIRNLTVVKFSSSQLHQRLAYFGHRCWMCGAEANSIDHVKPLSKGGAHALANIRPACHSCNCKKRDQWPYELAAA